MDASGKAVEFSIIVSASSPERVQMATIIQDDLRKLGMRVQVVPLEFRALVDRVLNSHELRGLHPRSGERRCRS